MGLNPHKWWMLPQGLHSAAVLEEGRNNVGKNTAQELETHLVGKQSQGSGAVLQMHFCLLGQIDFCYKLAVAVVWLAQVNKCCRVPLAARSSITHEH